MTLWTFAQVIWKICRATCIQGYTWVIALSEVFYKEIKSNSIFVSFIFPMMSSWSNHTIHQIPVVDFMGEQDCIGRMKNKSIECGQLDWNQNVYNQVIDWIKAIYLNGLRLFNINLDVDWCLHALVCRKKPCMPWWFIHVLVNAEIPIKNDHSVECSVQCRKTKGNEQLPFENDEINQTHGKQ